MLLVHWPDKVFWEASSSLEAAGLMTRLLARLAARPRRMKLVWMVHDLAPHDGKWFKRLAWPPYAALLARLADGALTLSEGHPRRGARGLSRRWPASPSEHVWHPAYPGEALAPEARAAARAGLGWAEAERVYGYCGQLRPYKGVEDLIRAFAGLPDAGARLLVAGRPRDAGLRRGPRRASPTRTPESAWCWRTCRRSGSAPASGPATSWWRRSGAICTRARSCMP